MAYRTQFSLNHPTRPDVRASYELDDTGTINIEVGIDGSSLFRITTTASTDVELYEALGLLVDTGFFDRRDLLMALRWSQWFQPSEIHDADVRRAAEVIGHLRHITQRPTERLNYDRYKQHSRRRAAD